MAHISVKKYQQTTVSAAKEANPYQLVAMLFQKLLGNIASAKGAIQQKDHAKKGDLLSKAITIIGVLQGSLDFENGGDISQNLSDLYIFCSDKLVEANTNNDEALLDEIIQILLPIKAGWDSIPKDEQDKVSFESV
ncbi:flagellar export chaperone FliS [Thalassomonas haliotis]|uniref:Flagellar secretion chaperone FliS n=1 Tax=Thalassomonas haliotis TaxID=485448 RepID=A0ABY7VIB6_9GAMM|nr:flagellar export chaperone FliS [Thalassomonas haliotis]WDE13230.1 flagellar export chaperone FliS [Thalassomonas haliotis]